MAYKEVLRVEISEVIRRWQTGESRRHIASGTGLSKDTVGRYISAAEALGIARDGPGPDEEQVSSLAAIGRSGPRQREAPTAEKLAPWADQIYQWITVDRLQLTRIQELLAERDCRGTVLPHCTALWTAVSGGVAAPTRCAWGRAPLGK